MPTKIEIKHTAECDGSALKIRVLFCDEAAKPPTPNRNPLIDTEFNKLLDEIVQEAFDEGREFQRKNSKLVL